MLHSSTLLKRAPYVIAHDYVQEYGRYSSELVITILHYYYYYYGINIIRIQSLRQWSVFT